MWLSVEIPVSISDLPSALSIQFASPETKSIFLEVRKHLTLTVSYCPLHVIMSQPPFFNQSLQSLGQKWVSIGAGMWKVELYLKVLQRKINKVCKTFVNVFIYFFSSLQHFGIFSTCFYWLVYSAVCAQSVKGHCSIMLSLWARNCVKFTLLSDMIWILD